MTYFNAVPRSLRLVVSAALVAVGSASAAIVPASGEDTAPPAAAAATVPPVTTTPGASIDPATLAAAKDLMDVTGTAKNFDNIVAMLKTHVTSSAPDEQSSKVMSEAFDKAMTKFSGYKQRMLDDTVALYASKFTAAELKAVADFYRSSPGAKFLSEMPDLVKEGGMIGQKYAMQVMKDFKEAKDAGNTP